MTSEIFFMPLFNKAIISHLMVIVFLLGLIVYNVLHTRNRMSCCVTLFLIFLVLCSVCYNLYAMYHTRFEMTSDGLTIKLGIQSMRFRVEEICEVSIPDSTLKPKLRTCGFSLPGYSGGYHQLRNNERGLVFVTTFEKAVGVRTRDRVIVMSVETPRRFVDASHRYWKIREGELDGAL